MAVKSKKYILWLRDIHYKDLLSVGGKNASLGEMYSQLTKKGVSIPDGFAITTKAYWHFLKKNKIDKTLKDIFRNFNVKNIKNLQETGKKARTIILNSEFLKDLEAEIIKAYRNLEKKYYKDCEVAVRSSGVAEDMPEASFAGQFETFLNVRGQNNLLEAIRKCFASSFNDRVIAYREEKGFSQLKFALSVGVQKMVRSDLASAGVMFTLDTETGFPNVVLINSIYGVGEMIVKGKITPDEFFVFKPTLKQGYKPIIIRKMGRKNKKYIFAKKGGLREINILPKNQRKFSLTDEEVLTLSRWACLIEDHYSKLKKKWMPQDIEWAKDGKLNQLFVTQSRPETVHAPRGEQYYEEYKLKATKKPILTGIAVGNKIGQGKAKIIPNVSKLHLFRKGEVLVTKMTDPDWVPVLRMASAVITDEGSRTCHAAIVSRELGIPAVVGTNNATKILKSGKSITIDCASGTDGKIYLGTVPFQIQRYNLKKIPKLKTKIMMNLGTPDIAFKASFLPNRGVGLARIEFILADKIKIHPLALYHFKKLKDKKLKKKIEEITFLYKDKKDYFIEKLAEGIAQIASVVYPEPTIVRLSDFKTNEYRELIGGELFEPKEANPMLGWRGASRYYDEKFKPAFQMECQALKKAREEFGLKNIWVMVPFCRTPEEGKKVLQLMAKNGLEKGKDNLKVIVMCEIPSNVILASQFLKIFNGISIGSNDLTQLVLGLDRDSAIVAKVGDERNEAVKEMVRKVIKLCREKKKYCGICGQAPSDYLEFAEFLVKEGIESMSLNPDTVIPTTLKIAKKEKQLKGRKTMNV
jgi:pyruvate,water dikinase